ncbi:hypothetical protein GHK03_24625 [Sinorhizobium medicae]|nr:hypothetical protein [Sinorhizobium medicae]
MQDAIKSRSSSIPPRFDTRGSVLRFVRGSVFHFARHEARNILVARGIQRAEMRVASYWSR